MELKEIVAKNLTELRKYFNYTQLELAEKLNYSDKAVSKWERGESLPDVETIKHIADLYGVSVDTLLSEQIAVTKKIKRSGLTKDQQLFITLLSTVGVWVLATLAFVVMRWCGLFAESVYSFIVAIPITFIVLIVFNSIWGTVFVNLVMVSSLLWSIALVLFLMVPLTPEHLWFVIAAPVQIAFFLWYALRISNFLRKRRASKQAEKQE